MSLDGIELAYNFVLKAIIMDAILVSSNNKGDTDLLLKLLNKMGLKSKLFSETEKEDYGLLAAMSEADRSEIEDESVIINKVNEKCR
jgi:hypothetical protein